MNELGKIMQKGTAALFLLIAGLLVMVGIFGIFYFKSPKQSVPPLVSKTSPQPPKDLTYNNQKLNLQFQYPIKDWVAKEDTEEAYNQRGNGDFRKNFKSYVGYEPGKPLGAVVVLGQDQNYDTNPFSLWIFDNPNNLTVDNWFSKYWYYPFLWGVFDYTSKSHITLDTEATISGTPAKSKIVTYQPGKPKFIYAAKDQKIYLFRVIGDTGDKILSTFKFN